MGMLLAIICRRGTELVVLALTKHHPMDTILTTVMTRTNNHPTDMILISHHTMNMKNLMRNHTDKNMNQSLTNQNMSLSHTMHMKNLLTRNHTKINMSPSHTMIMKPLITIPISLMIITQSLSMSITKNIPIHLPNTSMATNHLGTRNMAAVIIITKNHMGVTK